MVEQAGARPPPPWAPMTPTALGDAASTSPPTWLGRVAGIVGETHVLSSLAERWAYCRDRSPYAIFHVRSGVVPATLPAAVACPGDVDELAALLTFAAEARVAVIPFGGGSGVLGGTLPLSGELIIDLKRLNRVLALDETDATVTVQAGMNGGQLEALLNARGFTTGHLPQSLHMSTVGGWVACRSAGQNSSRYGKIEDMVLGIEAVLAGGRRIRCRASARHAAGPELAGLFVGAEGTLGVVSEVTLRIWRLPEARLPAVLGFPSLGAGLAALRGIVQTELRPSIVRLYDETESLQRTRGQRPFEAHPCVAILEFSGPRALADVERRLALGICGSLGAVEGPVGLYDEWQAHRFGSYSTQWHAGGHYMDTVDVVAPWSRLESLYRSCRDAVEGLSPDFHFGAHWSHVYAEGACQYMTMRLPPMPERTALDLLRSAWDRVQTLCLEAGGSIAHHHGLGLFRNPWLPRELGAEGMALLQALKDQLDPHAVLVPGKLGLDALGSRSRKASW